MTGGYPLLRRNMLISYARCSTDKQGLEANRQILVDLGVDLLRMGTRDGMAIAKAKGKL